MGVGATAEVFLAAGPNPRGAELLALKIILRHLASEPARREGVLREARVLAQLSHPNVVEVYEVGEHEERPFIAMEFIDGWPVSALLKKTQAAGERWRAEDACAVVQQAAQGLHYAHQARGPDGRLLGVLHRDISPQNLIVSQAGVVKLVDFGLARMNDAATVTPQSGVKGKLPYLAPEQLKSEPIDAQADVFALGAVLWELVLGERLHPGNTEAEIFQQALFLPPPTPRAVDPTLSDRLAEVLERATARERLRRYANAAELASALKPWVTPDHEARLAELVRAHFAPLPKTAREAAEPDEPPAPPPERAARTDPQAPVVEAPRRRRTRTPRAPERSRRTAWRVPRWAWGVLGLVALAGAVLFGGDLRRGDVERASPAPAATLPVDPTQIEPVRRPKRARGKLIVRSNAAAWVKDRGRVLGMTPLTQTLAAGTHRFTVESADGSKRVELEVVVPAGGQVERDVTF